MKTPRLLLTFALSLAALVPMTVAAPSACAAAEHRAVLVVDVGDEAYAYCVELPEAAVTGLELIVLANDQHGLTYRFDEQSQGQAVCMLHDVGSSEGDCFEDYPEFWGYWRGSESGEWTWSSSGAGSTTVRDGDVEGWSWGTGQDGDSHPEPPPTTFGSVCPKLPDGGGKTPGGGPGNGPGGRPQDPRGPGERNPGPGGRRNTSQDGRPNPEVPRAEDRKRRKRAARLPLLAALAGPSSKTSFLLRRSDALGFGLGGRVVATPSPTFSPAVIVTPTLAAEPDRGDEGGGPSAAALAALGLTAALVAGGVVFLRRRASS